MQLLEANKLLDSSQSSVIRKMLVLLLKESLLTNECYQTTSKHPIDTILAKYMLR